MAEAEDLQVSRNVWDARNAHDVDRYLKLLGENYLLESDTVPHPIRDPQSARLFMEMYNDGLMNAIIEGSSLYGPGESVLDIGENTVCFFRHSSSDSKSGDGTFISSGPDGIGNR